MPAVMRVACNRCDYRKRVIRSITVVIKADGSGAVCPHPGEVRRAEAVTGLSWWKLKRAGRIRHRNAMVCLGCGDLEYYAPRINRCQACGLNTLKPLAAFDSEWAIFVEFVNWVRRKPSGPICPLCHHGRLSSNMVGIS